MISGYITNGLCYGNIKVDPQPTRLASCSCRGAALCLFSKVDAHCPFPQSPLPSPHTTPTGIPRLRRLLARKASNLDAKIPGHPWESRCVLQNNKDSLPAVRSSETRGSRSAGKKKRMPLALPGRGQAAGECLRSCPARQHGIAGTPPATHGRLYSVATAAATTEHLLGVGDVRPVHRVRPRRNQISVWYC